jgi:ligand-binding sensor domain-containing protein
MFVFQHRDMFRSIRFGLLLILGMATLSLSAQLAIGDWKTHLSYHEAKQVADGVDRIYCGTQNGLFYYHRKDNTVQIITKVEGLSDLEINTINFSRDQNILLIGYANANIDIIEGTDIHNIPDIQREQITGNKTIHNILFIDEYAYLSCGFGIVVINLTKKEIKDTYYIGQNGGLINVYDMAFDGTWLYAGTENGIYKADINNQNLIDFNNWSRIQNIPHSDGKFTSICWFGNKLYANFRPETGSVDSLYYYDEYGFWHQFQAIERSTYHHVGASHDRLLVVSNKYVGVYDADNQKIRHLFATSPNHAILDDDNILWAADRREGMHISPNEWTRETIAPNGPLSKEAVSIAVMDDILYTVAGSVTSGWNNTWNHAELNTLQENVWSGTSTVDYRDLINLAIDPADKHHVFAASWGYGLLEYRNGELVEVYDQKNSTLQTFIENDNYYRLGGVVYDRAGNLWVSNSNVPEPISVRTPDGKWKSYDLKGKLKVNALSRIINTQYNHYWVLCAQGRGLFAFDINGTLEEESDDSYEKFDVVDANNKVISNSVFAFAEDRDGNIWVGTDKGIVVYYSPTRVFDEGLFYGQQIIVPRNDGTGLADILLGTEKVTAIAVDGANRKWVGTAKAGIFLFSDDGLETIHHFTTDNSPLLSDNILDIAVDGKKGTVYFGTEKGLISYKSTAIDGKENFGNVYVYPNPVREDYEGEIVITGLVENVNVKITDISGNIVFETTSLGGQAIWDGRTFSGDRVHTGVYLIFCTNDDGSQTHITKLLVIN